VHPNGSVARFYFQIGTTAAYSTRTGTGSAGSGTGAVKVAVPIGDLTPHTKYHYRLVVVGLGGTIAGHDHTFSTTNVPLSVAATISPNPVFFGGSATVTGALSGTDAAGRQVVLQARPFPYVAPFANTGNAEVTNAGGGFSFAVTGLAQNTQFRVVTVAAPNAASPVLLEGVAVHVTFGGHVRRTRHGLRVRVSGSIAPIATDIVATLQKRVRGRWVQTARLRLTIDQGAGVLRYSRTLRLGHNGRYRVLAQVTDGARVSSVSRALTFRRPRR
jgi:hypothetical protein